MDSNHIRTSSTSTGSCRDRAMSILSDGYQTATTAPTSPATSLPDYSSVEGGEVFEIDKKTFEANIQHTRKDSCQSEKPPISSINTDKPKIVNGSTLGGNDPLHAYIRAYDMEPKWWIEERQREERRQARPPTTKRKRSGVSNAVLNATYLDPTWYDTLSYSPSDAFTSGLDMEADPEATSEQFWEKVMGAWKLSMRYESVEERRDAFEMEELFAPITPEKGLERGEFRQEWYREELNVGETW